MEAEEINEQEEEIERVCIPLSQYYLFVSSEFLLYYFFRDYIYTHVPPLGIFVVSSAYKAAVKQPQSR